jgi:hypothetical protein
MRATAQTEARLRGRRGEVEGEQSLKIFVLKTGGAMNTITVTYLTYLAISISLTVWVAQTLHKNGRVFLIDVFQGNESLADSVNHLLVVGFYLINLGYVSLALKLGYEIESASEGIEALSWKVGMVLIVLGVMHFFNLFIFSRIRNRPHFPRIPTPVEPGAYANNIRAY